MTGDQQIAIFVGLCIVCITGTNQILQSMLLCSKKNIPQQLAKFLNFTWNSLQATCSELNEDTNEDHNNFMSLALSSISTLCLGRQ